MAEPVSVGETVLSGRGHTTCDAAWVLRIGRHSPLRGRGSVVG
jgi:hypothetical protein